MAPGGPQDRVDDRRGRLPRVLGGQRDGGRGGHLSRGNSEVASATVATAAASSMGAASSVIATPRMRHPAAGWKPPSHAIGARGGRGRPASPPPGPVSRRATGRGPLDGEALAERHLEGGSHGRDGGANRLHRLGCHGGREIQGGAKRLGGRDDAGDETEALGLRRRYPASGQDELHGPRLPDRPGEPLGPAGAGDHAEVDLGLAERRVVRGHDHVAGERQLGAAAEGVATHGRDRRRRDGRHPVPAAEPRRGGQAVGRLRRQLGDVGARREGPRAGPGDDDRPAGRIGVQRLHDLGQPEQEGEAEGVERPGPVEGHERHAGERLRRVDRRPVGAAPARGVLQQDEVLGVLAGGLLDHVHPPVVPARPALSPASIHAVTAADHSPARRAATAAVDR